MPSTTGETLHWNFILTILCSESTHVQAYLQSVSAGVCGKWGAVNVSKGFWYAINNRWNSLLKLFCNFTLRWQFEKVSYSRGKKTSDSHADFSVVQKVVDTTWKYAWKGKRTFLSESPWCWRSESNTRPIDYESIALPTEPLQHDCEVYFTAFQL